MPSCPPPHSRPPDRRLPTAKRRLMRPEQERSFAYWNPSCSLSNVRACISCFSVSHGENPTTFRLEYHQPELGFSQFLAKSERIPQNIRQITDCDGRMMNDAGEEVEPPATPNHGVWLFHRRRVFNFSHTVYAEHQITLFPTDF